MINLSYKNILDELVEYLNKLKNELNETDLEYKNVIDKRNYLDTITQINFSILNKYLNDLWDITLPFIENNDIYEKYKTYTRDKLLKPFFAVGPLNKRIYDKPLGYDGDYLVVYYFYLENYLGDNLFDMFMNKYTCSIPVSKAHINRKKYFNKYIGEVQNTNCLNILSLGSGPAIEIIELLKANKNIKINIYLNDMEVEAIEFVKKQLDQYVSDNVTIKYLNMNILHLIKNIKKLELPKFDFIYSFGLFDYLNDRIANLVIRTFSNYLKDAGRFLITNVATHIPNKLNIEFLCNWKLLYRNSEQLINLSNNSEYSQKIVFSDEETNANLYLDLQK